MCVCVNVKEYNGMYMMGAGIVMMEEGIDSNEWCKLNKDVVYGSCDLMII